MGIKKLASIAAVAALALAAADLSASAQTHLTNGPNGMQPNRLSSHNPTGINGKKPSRMMMRRKGMDSMHRGYRRTSMMSRPLVVRRAPEFTPMVPARVVDTGPGTLVTGPLGFGSAIVALPFRGLNSIFPATGDFATNPLVLIGAPLHAIGEIAQLPFRIIGEAFGGAPVATY